MITKFKAFTLAEILITLGIIGVVAAMTIPNLISNINNTRMASQFKKTYSTLKQAELMAKANYGVGFGDVSKLCGDNAKTETLDNGNYTICGLFNSTLKGASYIDKLSTQYPEGLPRQWDEKGEIEGTNSPEFLDTNAGFYKAWALADGVNMIYYNTDQGRYGFIVLDLNGRGKPNKPVHCENPEEGEYNTTTLDDDTIIYASPCKPAKNGDLVILYFTNKDIFTSTNAEQGLLRK